MCVAAFSLSQKMHRSVTTKNLHLTCPPDGYEKHRKLRNLTDIVFVRHDAEKGPRSTMALDPRCFFSSDRRASKGFLIIQHCDIFVFFFCISAECPFRFFFCESCGRIGNEMFRKRKFFVTKRWVQLDKKRWRRTSLHMSHHTRRGLSSCELGGDLRLEIGSLMRQACQAGKAGDCADFLEK